MVKFHGRRQNSKLLDITITGLVFLISALAVKPTYGLAGSLGELESQVNNSANYRAELENYLITHGLEDDMAKSGLFLSMLDTFQLKRLVKAHMTECLSTTTPTTGHC